MKVVRLHAPEDLRYQGDLSAVGERREADPLRLLACVA
jgi:Flp pilus assembly CpaF family ATPase